MKENTVNKNLKELLEYLLNVLDSDRQDKIENLYRQTLNWEHVDRLPVIVTLSSPHELQFAPYPYGQVFQNPEKMLFNELVYAFNTSIASRDVLADDLPCTIRANFGTVIIASMFGACVEQVGDNPPWIRHDNDRNISLEQVLDHNPFDFSKGCCPQVVEMYQFYENVLSDYPELKSLIKLVLPDLQGPFDNLELTVGSDVFTELYHNQDLVYKALEAMTTAQIGFAQHLVQYISETSNTFSHQHATMIKGRILLRNDSVIMMSPAMYRNLIASHDEHVLRELGGGGIHSCGKIEDHIPAFLELPSILCLDLGQPELNNVDSIYIKLKQRRIPLTRLKVSREDLATARIMTRFPTGVSLLYESDSVLDAKETLKAYFKAIEKKDYVP
jgi:hypothetical protein